MRFLFTTRPATGVFHPLVSIARAVAAAGHEVAFACAASFMPTVEQAGFAAFPAGFDPGSRTLAELFPGWLAVPEYTRGDWTLPHVFVGVFATTMAPDLLSLGRAWSPDLIVRESSEYAGCVAAEVLGLPHASVRSAAPTSHYGQRHLVAAQLARLRELNGLPPDPDVAMPFRYLHLACEPPGFSGSDALAPSAHLLRPVNVDEGPEEPLPDWFSVLPDRPTVYATLGTEVSRRPSGLATFSAVLDALCDEPINLVVTVGRSNDPARFGPVRSNVHIAQYIPQGLLLPHCDVVVNQGGFSTVTGALNAGLPMVVIPISADQPENAEACSRIGVGVVVGPDERTPETIRNAVRQVLTSPRYRANAERVCAAMAALPAPDYAVELLERLAAETRPIRPVTR